MGCFYYYYHYYLFFPFLQHLQTSPRHRVISTISSTPHLIEFYSFVTLIDQKHTSKSNSKQRKKTKGTPHMDIFTHTHTNDEIRSNSSMKEIILDLLEVTAHHQTSNAVWMRSRVPQVTHSQTQMLYLLLTYPRHGAGLNRRVPICSQYDGGLAHSRPVACGVVLLCRGPQRVAVLGGPGTGGIFPEGRVGGHGSRDSRRNVFKRPISFVAVRVSRFIFRGTKSFVLVARLLRRRLRGRVRVRMRGGRWASGSVVVRFVACKSRSRVALLRRIVADRRVGRGFGHILLVREILQHYNVSNQLFLNT